MMIKVCSLLILLVGVSAAVPVLLENIMCTLMTEMKQREDSSNLCKQTVDDVNATVTGSVFGVSTQANILLTQLNNNFCSVNNLCGLWLIQNFVDYQNGTAAADFNLTNSLEFSGRLKLDSLIVERDFGEVTLSVLANTLFRVSVTVTDSCGLTVENMTVNTNGDVKFINNVPTNPIVQSLVTSNKDLEQNLVTRYQTGFLKIMNDLEICRRVSGWLI